MCTLRMQQTHLYNKYEHRIKEWNEYKLCGTMRKKIERIYMHESSVAGHDNNCNLFLLKRRLRRFSAQNIPFGIFLRRMEDLKRMQV